MKNFTKEFAQLNTFNYSITKTKKKKKKKKTIGKENLYSENGIRSRSTIRSRSNAHVPYSSFFYTLSSQTRLAEVANSPGVVQSNVRFVGTNLEPWSKVTITPEKLPVNA